MIYSQGSAQFSSWSTLRYSALTCLLGSIVNLFVVALASAFQWITVPDLEVINAVKYEMAFMIFLPGLAALLCWNAGLRLIGSLNGILFINFVPITTLVIMAFQGYSISFFEIFGTLLVIYALLRNNIMQRKTMMNGPRKQASVKQAQPIN